MDTKNIDKVDAALSELHVIIRDIITCITQCNELVGNTEETEKIREYKNNVQLTGLVLTHRILELISKAPKVSDAKGKTIEEEDMENVRNSLNEIRERHTKFKEIFEASY